jgi:hypothetical protein
MTRARLAEARSLCLALFFAWCVSSSTCAAAETLPPELQTARTAFAKAIADRDTEAAAQLASFPLENTEDRGPKTLSKSAFVDRIQKLPKDVRLHWAECLKSEKPEKDAKRKNTWAIVCDQGNNIYYFSKISDKWLYRGYESVAE